KNSFITAAVGNVTITGTVSTSFFEDNLYTPLAANTITIGKGDYVFCHIDAGVVISESAMDYTNCLIEPNFPTLTASAVNIRNSTHLGASITVNGGTLYISPNTSLAANPTYTSGTLTDDRYKIRSGATGARPAQAQIGDTYFDTSLGANGKPIWYDGNGTTGWADATRAAV
ncbi:MAG: hypothetical protein ACXADY_26705, partial [Candidatus Hodarchaeales archaeon]